MSFTSGTPEPRMSRVPKEEREQAVHASRKQAEAARDVVRAVQLAQAGEGAANWQSVEYQAQQLEKHLELLAKRRVPELLHIADAADSKIEELEAENERLRKVNALRQRETATLRKTLRFYGSRTIWETKQAGDDLGERARESLRETANMTVEDS